MLQLFAAIDLGTNTARLLVAALDSGGIAKTLLLERIIVRLGGGFSREEGISPDAEGRALDALRHFANELGRFPGIKLRAVATSAVRDAKNRTAFCNRIFAETGIHLEVIDGHHEALLTLCGVISGLDKRNGKFLIFDVGGGSTEYVLAQEERPLMMHSLPLGVVRLTEGKNGIAAMREKIRRELAVIVEMVHKEGLSGYIAGATLVGTAGTATTLAAIHLQMDDYDYRKVNNHIMNIEDIERIEELLLPMTPAERLHVIGLESGREDLIIAGILITLETMRLFDFKKLKISDFGLLEGVLLSIPSNLPSFS